MGMAVVIAKENPTCFVALALWMHYIIVIFIRFFTHKMRIESWSSCYCLELSEESLWLDILVYIIYIHIDEKLFIFYFVMENITEGIYQSVKGGIQNWEISDRVSWSFVIH
jgi:hypothetical protein